MTPKKDNKGTKIESEKAKHKPKTTLKPKQASNKRVKSPTENLFLSLSARTRPRGENSLQKAKSHLDALVSGDVVEEENDSKFMKVKGDPKIHVGKGYQANIPAV